MTLNLSKKSYYQELTDAGLEIEGLYKEIPDYRIIYRSLGVLSTAFGMYMRGDTLANIGKSLLSGNGIRKTARIVGVSKVTVRKLYKILIIINGDILCPCGKPTTHQGWCWYRYARSPKRQGIIKRMHSIKALLLLKKRHEIHLHDINRVISLLKEYDKSVHK